MGVSVEKIDQINRVIVDTTNEGRYARRTIFKENLRTDHAIQNYQPVSLTKLSGIFGAKTLIELPTLLEPSKTESVVSRNSAEEIAKALESVGMRKLVVSESTGHKARQFLGSLGF